MILGNGAAPRTACQISAGFKVTGQLSCPAQGKTVAYSLHTVAQLSWKRKSIMNRAKCIRPVFAHVKSPLHLLQANAQQKCLV
jgi:hypothetical protein